MFILNDFNLENHAVVIIRKGGMKTEYKSSHSETMPFHSKFTKEELRWIIGTINSNGVYRAKVMSKNPTKLCDINIKLTKR